MAKHLLFFLGLLLLSICQMSFADEAKNIDFKHFKGPDDCAECHEDEAAIWNHTHHSKSFKSMPRSKKGRKIAKALGIRRIKTSENCVACHFTRMIKKTSHRIRTIAGPSCESCHGAGGDWMDIHGVYNGKNITAEQETPSHKIERWRKSEKLGIIRPIRLYKIYSNCYVCHIITDEKLVNDTEHPTNGDFELVSWSQGEMRHRVWYSKGKSNKLTPIKTRRMMYVLGQALTLEYAIKGLATATTSGNYSEAMKVHIQSAISHLEKVNQLKNIPEISQMLTIAKQANITINNKEQLMRVSERIADLNKQFSKNYNGEKLAVIDKLLPAKSTFKGKPKI